MLHPPTQTRALQLVGYVHIDINKTTKAEIRSRRRKQQTDQLDALRLHMSPDQLRANDIAQEVGSSNWLSALPLEEKGYVLTKREFWDALCLRYSWSLPRLPSMCVCGSRFNVSHAFSCKKGGFVVQWHNELRDLTGELLSGVCRDVCIEPALGELTGESLTLRSANTSDEVRLDISARAVWTKGQRAFFDVRVFDPLAQSHQGQTLAQEERRREEAFIQWTYPSGGTWDVHTACIQCCWRNGTWVFCILQATCEPSGRQARPDTCNSFILVAN